MIQLPRQLLCAATLTTAIQGNHPVVLTQLLEQSFRLFGGGAFHSHLDQGQLRFSGQAPGIVRETIANPGTGPLAHR
jgi:hypothetical protein